MIQLVLGSLHHFCKDIFSRTLSRNRRFSGNFKTSIQNTFSWIFFTYLFSINNQLLIIINIYYFQYWFWKMSRVLCSRLFHIFQHILLKYSSLYTSLQIVVKRLYRKAVEQSFYWRKWYLWDICNESKWA